MALVYLETSFFSACVSARTSAKSVYWREISNEWWTNQRYRHSLHVSDEVVAELSDPAFGARNDALAMVRETQFLELRPDVIGLAVILVREKVMPSPPVAGDAIHMAVSIYYRMDYVLSWNVRHLANPRKRDHLRNVCMRLGLIAPQVVTPELLTEVDDE